MEEEIPLSKPYIDEEDISAVVEALKSGWLTAGPRVKMFEERFAEYIGTKYAVALNSCTAALDLALKVIGVREGDEVAVPSFTFSATVNAVLYQRAKPVFIDIDEETFNMDPNDLQEKVSRKTKAVIPVHIAGNPCNMKAIMEIAKDYKLFVIEDAAEALGAKYYGKKVGSFGIGCFSFYPTKNITTGEGGMLTTDDLEVARKATILRGHGMATQTWEREASRKPWERIQVMLGHNFRMTDFQAALGLSQLRKLDLLNERRRKIAQIYNEKLPSLGIYPQKEELGGFHVYQMYVAKIADDLNIDRDSFVLRLRKRKISVSVHFDPPVHLMPYYQETLKTTEGMLPVTERVSKSIITLPMYPSLEERQAKTVLENIDSLLAEIAKS